MTELPILDPVPPPDPTLARAAARYVADPAHGLDAAAVREVLDALGLLEGVAPRNPQRQGVGAG